MYLNDVVTQAHAAVAGAIRDKQYRAIPSIVAGYATAVTQWSLTASTLHRVPFHKAMPGSYYATSPTRIMQADENIVNVTVPEITLVCRPVLEIGEDIDYEKIESVLLAIPVAIDRMYLNLIKQCGRVTPHEDIMHDSQFALRWLHGIAGTKVPRGAIYDSVSVLHYDYSALEHRSMGDSEVILINGRDFGMVGSFVFSPVSPDSLRSSGLAYRLNDGKLELGFSMRASVMIREPDAFTLTEI